MYKTVDQLSAPKNAALYVWFEPWAEGLGFAPGMTIELHAESVNEGRLEIDASAERTVIYGWPGCTLKVIVEGETVEAFDQAVPDVLSSLSTKETVQMLFGTPPVPNAEERAKLEKKA